MTPITPIERLRRDHAVLRAKLALLENALLVGPEAAFAIRELVYTLGRRLAEHERREEVELYPVAHDMLALQRDADARALAREHRTHERLLAVLHRLTLRGLWMPMARVRMLGRQFVTGLRQHLAREEALLFPLLERLTADRAVNAQAKIAAPDGLLRETMTVNRIIGLYPETQRVFADNCVCCDREGADFLDEVAWRHAVPVAELLRRLRAAARCRCGAAAGEPPVVEDEQAPAEEPFIYG